MGRYLLVRLFAALPVVLGVSVVIFMIIRLIPGDPARLMLGESASDEQIASYRHEMGYDQPLIVQYWRFLSDAATGDLGRSLYTRQPVSTDLLDRLPATLELAATSLILAFVCGVAGGLVAALKRDRPSGLFASLITLVGISIPSFWLGLVLMIVFGVKLQWLPVTGRDGPLSVLMPATALGLSIAAIVARMMRSSFLEVLNQDYIRTARAKGLAERRVVFGHAFKSSLLPTITILGLEVGSLIGGAAVIETVFNWPGIGQYLITAVSFRDYPAIQATVLYSAIAFVLANVLVDIMYSWLDPRIRLT